MVESRTRKCDLLIIDTNKYAGNFEREMCSFITGVVGECGVGTEDKEKSELFKEIIIQAPDEHGTCRPVLIYPNPNHSNNGLGFQYAISDNEKRKEGFELNKEYHINRTSEEIASYKSAIRTDETYSEESEKGYVKAGWTQEALINSLEYNKRENEKYEAMVMDDYREFSAYNSVAIVFKEGTLTPDILNLCKERAYLFSKSLIEGFRIQYAENVNDLYLS